MDDKGQLGLLPKSAMQVETGSIRLQGEELTTKSDAACAGSRSISTPRPSISAAPRTVLRESMA